MKNIHIRYEDKISDPGHPFAAGITLKELSALSTDDTWKPMFISEPTNTINKVKISRCLSNNTFIDVTVHSLLHLSHCQCIGILTPDPYLVCIMKKQLKYILTW
jgi:vacuolar protein sorting-associated protein 13A/C